MSRFEDGNDSDLRVTGTVEARSAEILGPPGGRNWVASRAPAATPRAAPKSWSSRENPVGRMGNLRQASNSEAMT